MADWDPSTIASVAALVVATLALVIALAQALQQFFMTGQLIRICDSVVFGPMPGQGRRVWQLSQFRFRVLYSIPQISLHAELWPFGDAHHVKSYAIGRHPLPWLATMDHDMTKPTARFNKVELWGVWKRKMRALLFRPATRRPSVYVVDGSGDLRVVGSHAEASVSTTRWRFPVEWSNPFQRRIFSASWWSAFIRNRESRTDDTSSYHTDTTSSRARFETKTSVDRRVGEASWVSFCRAVEIPCGNSVRLDHVQYDADRCPSDLVSAPMQVSMRDIIVMGLMAGMDITSASFHEKSVSMQGAVGTITSSKHAVLGPILHFTPRNVNEYERGALGFGHYFGLFGRGFIDSYWLARTWGVCCVAQRYFNSEARRTTRRLDDRWIRDQDNPKFKATSGDYAGRSYKSQAWMRDIVMVDPNLDGKKKADTEDESTSQRGKEVIKTGRAIPEVRPQDGEWSIRNPLMPPRAEAVDPTIDQQLDRNARCRQTEVPRATKASETLDERQNVQGTLHIPTQERTKSENNLKSSRPRLQATVEDLSDHESESPSRVLEHEVSVMKSKAQDLRSDTEAAAEEASRNSSEEAMPVLEDDGQRAAFKSEDISRGARQTGVSGGVLHEYADIRNDEDLSERAQTAKRLQAIRAEKLRQVQRDKEVVEDSVKRGALPSPLDRAAGRSSQLLLTDYAHNERSARSGSPGATTKGPGAGEDYGEDEPTKEEREAYERELKREQERTEREKARDERNNARNRAVGLEHVDIYWMSQMDVMRGYSATPWHRSHIPIYTALTGCITVVLEALLGFMEPGHIAYTNQSWDLRRSFNTTTAWMCEWTFGPSGDGTGSYNHSYPAYAHNAKGGVIAAGVYTGCRIPSFPSRVVPVLELARSYDWQVSPNPRSKTEVEQQNVELVRIDSWLSYVGRLDEISDGPHRLLSQTPALIKLLMDEFELDFQNIDLSADQGGLQDIQGLAANVMDFLTDEELSEAEQLYVLVALLRSAKVAQSVLAGSDTYDLYEILTKDVLAHLV